MISTVRMEKGSTMAEYIINTDMIPVEVPDKSEVVTFFGEPVQELIRCEKCKSRSEVSYKNILGFNLYRCYFHECIVRDGDFCSFADRKVVEREEK